VRERVLDVFDYKPFDLLHIHDFQLLPLARMLREEGALDGVPLVFTWHIPFTMDIPEDWRRFIAGYMKDYDKTIVSTPEYVETALRSGLPREKVEMVYPFIDPSEYARSGKNDVRQRLGVGRGDVLFACVSRIDPRKGQEVLIEALASAVPQNRAIKCVFVGNGSFSRELLGGEREARKKRLLSMVSEAGLEGSVFFTGHLPDRELFKVYDACDASVQPSLQEGFGLTVSEAMCFGKPVIGSRVGGIPVQIKDGVNGRLFEPGDSAELSRILLSLAGDSEMRGRMGAEGKKIVNEKFSSRKGFERHEQIYGSLLGA
jgi:glycosyltransferase involved in cell wall biosynthesis